ncbi:DNA-3-methyladenine glycosylase I [Nocardioides bizhenqiangii]|uniref:DNA-3-methyladenine glycosylase I n=1 Tax=Nocardioides bizhenqiangii TaxID=3095076 RepID=A0ABZ0ZRS8_9ACTN|nr:DNA-3-methyladenine glycosylase I [Nocardioides sp. HM61]WQQ27043.1 DNA-3-methyladenine glycosylase I [Nocardioides sp. HM61]
MDTVTGEDGITRCAWAGAPGPMRDYHDDEWGHPVVGESAYFERMTLEAFQSGLSWATILAKRPAFREVFAGFDADAVADFDETDVERLMGDARIVRNRSKIEATLQNARAIIALRDDGGLERLILGFAPSTPPPADATTSTESVAMAKDLKRRGFAFVGPTTAFALMQALGLFDPHVPGCHRRKPD